jgi:iron(III) transport system substrate-binding protein
MKSIRTLRRRRRVTSAMAALALLAAALTACGGDDSSGGTASDRETAADPAWQKIVDAAIQQGEVLVYSAASPAQIDRTAAAFEKAWPEIKVEIVPITSTEQTTRLQQEIESGSAGADVAWNSQIQFFRDGDPAGWFVPPAGPSEATWPEEFKINATSRLFLAQPVPIQWNTTLVSEPITGYEDLLRPELKGKIALGDIDAGSIIASLYTWLQDNVSPDIWEKLAAQDPKFYIASSETAQAVASGEIAAAGYGSIASSNDLINQGAPIEYIVPTPAFSSTQYTAVIKNGPHNNAGLVFLDWITSVEGQTAAVGEKEFASPLNVPGVIANIEDLDLYQGTETPEEVASITADWKQVFGRN